MRVSVPPISAPKKQFAIDCCSSAQIAGKHIRLSIDRCFQRYASKYGAFTVRFGGSSGTGDRGDISHAAVAKIPRRGNVVFRSLGKCGPGGAGSSAISSSGLRSVGPASLEPGSRNQSEYEVLIPAAAEAVLLLEFSGDDAAQVRQSVTGTVDRVRRKTQLAFDARQAFDSADVELYWQLARRVVPTLHRLKGSVRPVPIVEDVAVPPAALPDFLIRLQNTLKRLQITASLYAHASHGQLHVRPFIDLAQPDDVAKLQALATELYTEVLAVGGTISGEHGDGFSRTPFIRQQYGPLYDVFREVKDTFDPLGILNPGKIVADMPAPITDNLRPAGANTNGAAATIGVGTEAISNANEPANTADANTSQPPATPAR